MRFNAIFFFIKHFYSFHSLNGPEKSETFIFWAVLHSLYDLSSLTRD